jgi:lipid II:glycine glycyltransferase (peptidoglycan interpeptide bridge formation enzyme)
MSDDSLALVSQSPEWLRVICAAAHCTDASRYYELPDGQRMVLPLVRLPGPLMRFASPPAAWGFGGLISARPLRPSDVAAVFDDLKRLRAAQITVRPNPLDAGVWQAGAPAFAIVIPRCAHVIDLEGGYEKVAKRFDRNVRSCPRKAERLGVTLECDTTDRLIPEIYRLYMKSLERFAAKQHEPVWLTRWRGKRRDPIEKLLQMSRGMNGVCRWYVARVNGQIAAASLVLLGKNAHATRAMMNREYGTTGANYLVQRNAIEDACKAGCRWYHLGESGKSESLAAYKEHFGAKPYDYAEYRIEHLPVTKIDTAARNAVKRLIGFKDV